MRVKAFVKLFIGFIIVIAIVLGLTLVLNRRINQVTSRNATISSGIYTVGTEYSGLVTNLNVKEGEHVEAGQEILTLQSDQLKFNFSDDGSQPSSNASRQVSPSGMITLTAPDSGRVSSVKVREHSFTSAGSSLVTVNVADTQFVEATVNLESRDYARLHVGSAATIILPDQLKIPGTVSNISVSPQEGGAHTLLHIESEQLRKINDGVLTATGTPVTVLVRLDDRGAVSETLTSLQLFLQHIGA